MPDGSRDGRAVRFLTLDDTAQLLNVGASEVFGLVESGELAAIHVGGSWRIERGVLESYIEALYEATRRMTLWNQSEYADLSTPTFGERHSS